MLGFQVLVTEAAKAEAEAERHVETVAALATTDAARTHLEQKLAAATLANTELEEQLREQRETFFAEYSLLVRYTKIVASP